MLLELSLSIACMMMGGGEGVRMSSMGGIRYAMEGTNVTLSCEFDLEGDDLYSLLWWRGGSVLLRYTAPHAAGNGDGAENGVDGDGELVLFDPISNVTTRALAWFPSKGLNAQLGPEGGPEELWLLHVGHEASGVYTCEVTTEAPPTFLTANASVTVAVVVPPSVSPLMQGTTGYVQEGQWVAARCDSAPALPPPIVTFYINGQPVSSVGAFKEWCVES